MSMTSVSVIPEQVLSRLESARRKLRAADLVLSVVQDGIEAPPPGYTAEEWVRETGVEKVLSEMGV
jgi:hypothetical protein